MRRSNFYGSGVGLQPPRSIPHIAPAHSLYLFTLRCQAKQPTNDDRRDAAAQSSASPPSSGLSRPEYRRPSSPAPPPSVAPGGGGGATPLRPPLNPTPPIDTPPRPPRTGNLDNRQYFESKSPISGRYRTQNYQNTQSNINTSNNYSSGSQSKFPTGRPTGSNNSNVNNNNNTSGNYGRAPPVRRWMSDLAKQLEEVLDKDYEYTSSKIDPQVSRKILSLMPEAISVGGGERQEREVGSVVGVFKAKTASSSRNEVEVVESSVEVRTGIEEEKDFSSTLSGSRLGAKIDFVEAEEETEKDDDDEGEGEKVEEEIVPSVYDAELAAILSHYQTTSQVVEESGKGKQEALDLDSNNESVYLKKGDEDDDDGLIELSTTTEKHVSSFPTSPSSNANAAWRPKIGEGSLMLLIRIIADSNPQAALQLYKILDSASYPTRTPRFLGNMVGLLVKKNQPEAAAAVLRDAILAEKTAADSSSQSPSSASTTFTSSNASSRDISTDNNNTSSGTFSSANIGPGKYSDAWSSLSRCGRPEIVQNLIQELETAGIPADTDTYVCSIHAYARVKDTAAAVACFDEMQRQGIERTSAVFAALARAAADGGDVKLAMKVLHWAEKDAETNPSLKLMPVWRELLVLSCSGDTAPGLRAKLVDRLERQKRHITCDLFNKVVVPAAETGNIIGVIDLFTMLRSKGLISGIPVVRGADAGADGGAGDGVVGSLLGSRGELILSGMEYEQVTLDDMPTTDTGDSISQRGQRSSNNNKELKNLSSPATVAVTATATATTLTSLTDSDTDTDSDGENSMDIISGYSDTESEGEEELEEEELELETLPNNSTARGNMTRHPNRTNNSSTTSSSTRGHRNNTRRSKRNSNVGPSSPAAAQFLYTSLIVGAHKARLDDPMKQIYAWLHEDGLLPNRPIMTRMVACLPYANDPIGALNLYEYIRKLQIPMDGFMYGHIIAAILGGPQGRERWDAALLLTHRMHIAVPSSHDTSVQTSMVVTAGKNGWVSELLALYRLMLQDGVMPRPITWNAFITAAMRCNRPDLGFSFGVAMRKMGCSMDAATHSALFSCAAAQGDAGAAQKQWQAMLDDNIAPDCIACSSYMWALISSGKPDLAVKFFESWRKERKPPGWHENLTSGRAASGGGGGVTTSAAPTFSEVCTALLKGGRWDQSRTALQLQRWIKGQGEDPRSINLDQLRNKANSRGGRWAQASALADEAIRTPAPVNPPEPDSVSISFAATSYAQLGNQARALQLADEISSMDIPLQSVAFSTALDGCAAAGALDAALKLLRRARAAGLRPDQAAYGAAISAAGPHGDVSAALMVLNWMSEDGVHPNIIAINSALAVCASAIDVDAALDVFWRMKAEWGIDPDSIAYATLCQVLAKAGQWGPAVRAMLVSEGTIRGAKFDINASLLSVCGTDPPGLQIDLHGLSVAAASAAVRAWLLVLRRSPAVAAGKIDDQHVAIVTGKGRNSVEGVSRLKPGITSLLEQGLGGQRTLNFTTPNENQGMVTICGADLRAGLEDPELDLGFGSKEEEDMVWKLATGRIFPTRDCIPKPQKSPRS